MRQPVNLRVFHRYRSVRMSGDEDVGRGQGGAVDGDGVRSGHSRTTSHTLHLNGPGWRHLALCRRLLSGAADNSSLAHRATRRRVAWANRGRPSAAVNRSLAGVDMAAGGMAVTEREAWGGEVAGGDVDRVRGLAVAKARRRFSATRAAAHHLHFQRRRCGPHVLGILAKGRTLIYIEMFAMAFITACAGAGSSSTTSGLSLPPLWCSSLRSAWSHSARSQW